MCIRDRLYWALPENLHPSINKSFLPENSAFISNVFKSSIIGVVNLLKSLKLSLLFAINVKFILPKSWNTAPPPDCLLTTGIEFSLI